MTKRRYQSTDVKRIHWKQVAEAVAGGPLTVAVDVAKEDFMAALMKPGHEVVETARWKHPQETRLLQAGLLSLGLPAERIAVVMEPSGVYGDSLRYTLSRRGIAIWRVSPKRVHDAAEVFDGVPSLHDAKSAYLIGRLHQDGASERWEDLPQTRRDDQALLAELDLYRSEHRRNLNRLDALLSRHWPEAQTVLDLERASLLNVIAEYGDPYAIRQQRAAARQTLRQHGGRFLAEAVIEALLDSAADTLGVPCTAGERAWLQCLARALLRSRTQIHEVERRIQARTTSEATLQGMAATVGAVTSLVLNAQLGSPLAYPSPRHYLKALGLNLRERSSGKHHGQLHITKRGPPLARKYLYFAVLRWIQADPEANAWYRAKSGRDGDIHGKALIGLMRRLVKGLWHVARGARFESGKLFEAHPEGRPAMAQ